MGMDTCLQPNGSRQALRAARFSSQARQPGNTILFFTLMSPPAVSLSDITITGQVITGSYFPCSACHASPQQTSFRGRLQTKPLLHLISFILSTREAPLRSSLVV